MAINIIKEKCIGCGQCFKSCPKEAFYFEPYDGNKLGKVAAIGPSCDFCNQCLTSCKFGAIEEKKVEVQADLGDYKHVWVFAEQRDGKLMNVALELIGEGRRLAKEISDDTQVCAVLIGSDEDITPLVDECFAYGAEKVYKIASPLLQHYTTDAYTYALKEAIDEYKPEIVLYGATHIGRDFAPRIAARCNTGLTADCTRLDVKVSSYIEYAKKNDAELVIGVDPDSDRCGAVVRDGDEYIVLSGNQMACLMLDYIITMRKELGTMPERPFAVRSIVSTLMVDRICEMNDVKLFEVLTGFKFIGEKIVQYHETGEYNFIYGFEESIGFLGGTYARDKDAVFAAMMMAEVGCYYKAQGMSVYEGLQSLYKKYGYFEENTESTYFTGYDAQDKMKAVMSGVRANLPTEVGLKVVGVTDYLEDVPGFTKSNVLYFRLEDGNAVAVRPSGTEPKVKTYVMANGATAEEAEANCAKIRKGINALLEN